MRFFDITEEEVTVGIEHVEAKFNVTLDRVDLHHVMTEVQKRRGKEHLIVPFAMKEALDTFGIKDPARRILFKKAIGRILNFRKEMVREQGSKARPRFDIPATLEGDQFTFAIMPKHPKEVAAR